MIGLDTNVIVRYLTQDDPHQSPKATDIFEHRLSRLQPGFVSLVALVETVWVLQRLYRYSSADILDELERLLKLDSLVIERESDVVVAWATVKDVGGQFADALIAACGLSAGCSSTLTFDRPPLRLPGFEAE